jgi:serine/threonine protein phosphatase PrpC
VEVDLFEWKVWPGDKLLLCSDGLWRVFPDRNELSRWLGSAAEPGVVCEQLVDEASRRDGTDDMSALVIYIEGGDGHVDSGDVNNSGNGVIKDGLRPAYGLNQR